MCFACFEQCANFNLDQTRGQRCLYYSYTRGLVSYHLALTLFKVISKISRCNVIIQQKVGQAIHACKRPQLQSTYIQCVAGTVLILNTICRYIKKVQAKVFMCFGKTGKTVFHDLNVEHYEPFILLINRLLTIFTSTNVKLRILLRFNPNLTVT